MARPRKYSEQQLEAIWAARELGPTEIVDAAKDGRLLDGLAPFEIAKRTVQYHLARLARERPEDAIEPGQEERIEGSVARRLLALIVRQADRLEAIEAERPLTVTELRQLRETLRTIELAKTMRAGKRSKTKKEAATDAAKSGRGLVRNLVELEGQARSAKDASLSGSSSALEQ